MERRVVYPIRSYHGDVFGRLKPQFVLSFLEDIAWQNAEELGFGYTALKSQGRFWALTRLSLRFDRWPLWGEDLELETEPLGVSGPFALRRFSGFVDGKQSFTAGSGWVVLDGSQRRPLRPQTVFSAEDLDRFPGFSPEDVPRKVEDPKQPPEEWRREVVATYAELDVNNHVNNAEFLRWAFSMLEPARLKEAPAERIDINFLSELRAGSSMSLIARSDGPSVTITGSSEGTAVFRCALGFEV